LSSSFVIWFYNGKQFVVARVPKLTMAGEIALVSKKMGKLCLVLSAYQYRIHGKKFEVDKVGVC